MLWILVFDIYLYCILSIFLKKEKDLNIVKVILSLIRISIGVLFGYCVFLEASNFSRFKDLDLSLRNIVNTTFELFTYVFIVTLPGTIIAILVNNKEKIKKEQDGKKLNKKEPLYSIYDIIMDLLVLFLIVLIYLRYTDLVLILVLLLVVDVVHKMSKRFIQSNKTNKITKISTIVDYIMIIFLVLSIISFFKVLDLDDYFYIFFCIFFGSLIIDIVLRIIETKNNNVN